MLLKSALLFISLLLSTAQAASLYDFSPKNIKGKEAPLSEFKGKTVMIVNIATKCGFTPQLEDLEKLYKTYKAKGFVILGIPSNDFMAQTPETEEKVAEFCKLKYGVDFPLYSKVVVSGLDKIPLYQYLSTLTPKGEDVKWNFEKFLFDKNGKFVKHYSSSVSPSDAEVKKALESIL